MAEHIGRLGPAQVRPTLDLCRVLPDRPLGVGRRVAGAKPVRLDDGVLGLDLPVVPGEDRTLPALRAWRLLLLNDGLLRSGGKRLGCRCRFDPQSGVVRGSFRLHYLLQAEDYFQPPPV